jgi:probable phosphoglycerate mutase
MSERREQVVVEADGGSRGNPGPAGYGAVVLATDGDTVLAERSEFLGTQTNNVAEYRGLIAGLEAARELGARVVSVRMDSRLVVEQMSGRWQVKHAAMRPLARRANELVRDFVEVTFTWIPREINKRADRLANEAMDRGTGKATALPHGSDAWSADRREQPVQPSLWTPPVGEPTRVLLVRHGATAHSAEHRLSGHNQLSLSADGMRQAAALADRAASWGTVAAIVSSPLSRARETAEVVASRLRLPVSVDEGFAELDFGDWEGLTADEARERSPREFAAWQSSAEVAPPGGESFATLARRVRRARDAVIAAHPGERVLVVTHVTPIKTLVRTALEAPHSSIFRMHLDPGSLSRIDYFADGHSSLRQFNDVGRAAAD